MRMATKENPQLTSSHGHSGSPAIYGTIFSEEKNGQSHPISFGKGEGNHIDAMAAKGHVRIAWLWWPARAHTHGSYRTTTTNRERILQQLPPPSQQTQRQQTQGLVFL